MSTVLTPTDGTNVNLAITALNSLTNSATVGWKSVMVDNTSLKASDFRLLLKFAAVNTAPANDKAIYVYAIPWYYDGSTWTVGGDGGTTTLPTSADAGYTIASPNNLGPPVAILNYTTQNQPINGFAKLSNRFGGLIPDGWQLIVINYTGMTLAASGNQISYVPVTYVSV